MKDDHENFRRKEDYFLCALGDCTPLWCFGCAFSICLLTQIANGKYRNQLSSDKAKVEWGFQFPTKSNKVDSMNFTNLDCSHTSEDSLAQIVSVNWHKYPEDLLTQITTVNWHKYQMANAKISEGWGFHLRPSQISRFYELHHFEGLTKTKKGTKKGWIKKDKDWVKD